MKTDKFEGLKKTREKYLSRKDALYKRYKDPIEDDTGWNSSFWMDHLHLMAVASFVLDQDVEGFKEKMKESVKIKMELMDRRERGDPIQSSYFTMLCYQQLFDALASGDIEFAKTFAKKIENADTKEIHIIDRMLGISLVSLVLKKDKEFEEWNAKFIERCQTKDKSYLGYALVMKAIYEKDQQSLDEAFKELQKGHKQLSSKGSLKYTDQMYMNIWGLGLANLALHRSLKVPTDDEMIPQDLMVPINKT